MKKVLILILLLTLLGCAKQPTANHQTSGMAILTSLEATNLLTLALTDDTGIQTILTIPTTYSMNAHARYFKKHNKNFNEQSVNAAACVTIRSIWNHDDLYPYARRANVRVVEIDSSAPVDKTQAGVKLIKEKKNGKISPFIWRSPANLTKMADFIAKDLMALYPDQASQIDSNLKLFKQDLFKLRTKYEAKLIDLDSTEVISLTEDFDYLFSEFGIEVLDRFLKQQIDWHDEDIAALEKSIREHGIKAVICNHAPQGRIFEAIVNNGAQPVILDTLLTTDGQHLTAKQRLLGFFSDNLDKIYVGLK
ncbi:metal ABC transporter substrate-binding protein [Maridesulfovibrio salexigens]|uniref:Periplasmic solute binding protein n=1 Tax=Maridesulfovibrio salexigens (strain ATCC 14822 / DSM 2638 / NCIMB 8403 / VKM B-1763) TaxID=526222 RepID=C6C0C2_MARSD|nr:zinc ABC transporter substrate-binding protein [Maridesulfovibrio salexigens]ACS79056.1 periplasmic solute binding protein [Maridesulfovibrio salexigens DSM 2638]